MEVYIFQGDIYCEECGIELQRGLQDDLDSERYPQGPYPNGGGEADYPQHCGGCGLFLENPLTTDGERFVREAAEDWTFSASAVEEWRKFYSYLFKEKGRRRDHGGIQS